MGDSGVHPGVLKPHTEALVQGNLARVLRERFTGEQALLEAATEMLFLDVIEDGGVPKTSRRLERGTSRFCSTSTCFPRTRTTPRTRTRRCSRA